MTKPKSIKYRIPKTGKFRYDLTVIVEGKPVTTTWCETQKMDAKGNPK